MSSDEDRHRVERLLRSLPPEAYETLEPPPLDLDRALSARPGRTTAPSSPAALVRPRRRSWRQRLAVPLVLGPAAAGACAAVLLLVGLGLGAVLLGGSDPDAVSAPRAATAPAAWPVKLTPLPTDATSGGRARVDLPRTQGGTADLVVRGLPPSPSDHFYEVWLMTDTKRLVSIGTFKVGADGTAHVRFPVGADPHAYRYVDISLEPDNGDLGHSSKSVLRSGTLS